MVGSDDITLPPDTPFLADAGAQRVCRFLSDAGHEVFFVGGCVRNAVLDAPASDIDISTNAHPESVMQLAETAGLRAVPTGIEHGTVTVVVGETPYEVTTYRRDVETDGRRAVVAFADRLEDDAIRRDFTMNALYADPGGRLVDPTGGYKDALAGHVRFIHDARQRIREDYLRVLRFFRFWAYYAKQDEGFEPETLAAIADCLDGLETLSAERVGVELLKLLSAPDPAQAIATMEHIGVFARVAPIASTRVLPHLVHLEHETNTAPDALRRLACLGPDDPKTRLRLSKSDSRRLEAIQNATAEPYGPKALGFLLGETDGWSVVLLKSATVEQHIPPQARADVTEGAAAKFPISAGDLPPTLQGAEIGKALGEMRDRWLKSDLTLGKSQLLG